MARRDLTVERPQPKTRYRVLAHNSHVLKDWQELVRQRRQAAVDLWDHIAATPTTPVGARYLPLKGDQAHFHYEGQDLRQWQYEVDNRARVKVAVGASFVLITSVSLGHPKANE
ncbi:MAG: hypothetical protein M1401_05080 [Chloroflexi bacterium]|nr:hypothetical protein [Chloroflexota bacterium]